MKRFLAGALAVIVGSVGGGCWAECCGQQAACHDADYSEVGVDAIVSVERTAGVVVIGTAAAVSGEWVAKKASGAASVFHAKDFPGVGQWCTGWPSPYLVGAVAVDTYILPKVSANGYTESSLFTMTDFNPAPRLRNYVNYVAPMPYTHPPVYAAGTLDVGAQRPGAVYVPVVKTQVVDIEH